uniref:Protein kinase domain-containing protein n=1 Tax=Panagrolaimus sp. ES5 TaxID=591445 RepID=A0AC34GGV0_9BILA
MAANEDILPPGKIVNLRWKVEKKLGKGCCGAVYKVIDLEKKPQGKAALKTEKHGDDKSLAVLKKEVDVLQKLKERKHVPRLICSGRRNEYDYFVMTLLGKNLFELKKECNLGVFSAGCVSRVGIQVLYGVKQLHEIGYLHRDIKPANMVIGRGKETRIIYVIDYGMARKFGIWENGVVRHRKARDNVLLRGTHRYCSPFVHERIEQGRRDDIFSILYSLIFLHTGNLPWVGVKD